MEKKYELTSETFQVNKHTLHRIKALRDFGCVKVGDLGGFIETEDNLSQEGDCWVYDDAKVYDNAKVYGNATVNDSAIVCHYAIVTDNAKISDNAKIYDSAVVSDYAQVFNNAQIYGDARIYNEVLIFDNAKISGDARVYNNAVVCGKSHVFDAARLLGYIQIFGDAIIKSKEDYIAFKNWWSSGRYFTWTRSNNMWKVGCFFGTGQELIDKAYKDSEESGREYQRIVNYVQDILGLPHLERTK